MRPRYSILGTPECPCGRYVTGEYWSPFVGGVSYAICDRAAKLSTGDLLVHIRANLRRRDNDARRAFVLAMQEQS